MIQEISENRFEVGYDVGFSSTLKDKGISLAISTYQAGKLIFISPSSRNKIRQTPVSLKKPMGIALHEKKMAIATLDQIQIYAHEEDLAHRNLFNNDIDYDKLYLPRGVYLCGNNDLHDLEYGHNGLWAVNTRFSCLATFDVNYSFTPRWLPPFVKELTPDDQCHLNGMALLDGKPKYVTALGKTNKKEDWKNNITNGGILMNVPEGEIILDNLPMPHSPRLYNNKLYILLSATGEIMEYDIEKNKSEIIFQTGRFIRGLSIHDGLFYIAHSEIRKSSSTFEKLKDRHLLDNAGIIIIDPEKKKMLGQLTYYTTVKEIFDVQVLDNTQTIAMLTPNDQRHTNAITTKLGAYWAKNGFTSE